MKKAMVGIVALAVGLMAGCTAWFGPTIDFAASSVKGGTPLVVQFTPVCDEPIASYAWTFGDGATSDDPAPVHIYRTPGTYTVRLTAELLDGTIVETEKPDLVTASLRVSATAEPDYIYWIHCASGAIWRGAVGGGMKEKVVEGGYLTTLDVVDGWIYWADSTQGGRIYRMRTDGTDRQKLLTAVGFVTDIHVVPETQSIFWVKAPDYYGYDEDARGGLYFAFFDDLEPQCLTSCAPRADRVPMRVAVDVFGDRIYWTVCHYTNDREWEDEDVIRVTGTSGFTPTNFFTTQSTIYQIELDALPGFPAEHLYWFDHGYPTLRRMDLDDSHQQHRVLDGNELTGWFAVDRLGGKIYFASIDGVERCDLNGTNRVLLYKQDAMMGIAFPR